MNYHLSGAFIVTRISRWTLVPRQMCDIGHRVTGGREKESLTKTTVYVRSLALFVRLTCVTCFFSGPFYCRHSKTCACIMMQRWCTIMQAVRLTALLVLVVVVRKYISQYSLLKKHITWVTFGKDPTELVFKQLSHVWKPISVWKRKK